MKENDKLSEEFETIKQLLKADVQNLRKDVFSYLYQSRLQFFEQCCPYLTTPMPFKLLVSLSLGLTQTSPINFSIEEKIEAIDKDSEKIILHPLINGQILPFKINQTEVRSKSIKFYLGNDAGFFYIDNDYLDIWIFDEDEILANELFHSFSNANLVLKFILSNRTLTRSAKVKKLNYAYLHSNEILKDQLNDLNFYNGVRLYFENDFIGLEVNRIELIVSELSENICKEKLLKAVNINYVPLINYQTEYAIPIRLDGSQDSFPLLSDNDNESLSLLRIFSVMVHQNGEDGAGLMPIYSRVVSNDQEVSYDLVRPNKEHKVKNAHIILYNTLFERDLSLQIKAAWFNNKLRIGKLSKLLFLTKPVESIEIKPIYFSEKIIKETINLQAMHNIQNLTFQKILSGNDIIALINLLCSQANIESKLLPLINYFKDHAEDVYNASTIINDMHFIENDRYNCYLNTIFQIILKYHRSLIQSDN